MQRVLPHFPSGFPGVGLLTLRVVLALFLALEGVTHAHDATDAAGPNLRAIAYGVTLGALSIPVSLGFLTSVVHTAVALLELAPIGTTLQFVSQHVSNDANWQVRVLKIAIAVALALIGPGAYSVDRWLFGPRKIAIPPRQS